MTFGKLMKSVGSALMYFGIYLAWQFITVLAATFVITTLMSFNAGFDMAAQMMQNGDEYSYEQAFNAAMENSMSIITQASEWILEHTVHLTIAAGVLTLLTYLFIFLIRKKNPLKEVGIAKMPVLPCFGLVFLGAALNIAISFLLPLIPFPEAWWNAHAAQTELIMGATWWITLMLTALIAPLLEEVVFRGLVHTRLKKGMPMLAAMIISSWLFGVMHGTLIAFIYAALLGFLLAWVFEKYKSLLAPMLVHFGFNLCAMGLDELESLPTLACVAAAVVSVIGIALIQMSAKGKIEVSFPKQLPSVNSADSDK